MVEVGDMYCIFSKNITTILLLKKTNFSLSPYLIVLASWFRLKYPHIALGALASSAPILYFDDITPPDGYYSIVSRDFRVIYFEFSPLIFSF